MSIPKPETENSHSLDSDIESNSMPGWRGRGIQFLVALLLAVVFTAAMVVFERRDLREQVRTLQEMLVFQTREKDGAMLGLTREHARIEDLKELLVEIDQNSEQLIQNLAALRTLSADAINAAEVNAKRLKHRDAGPERMRDALSEALTPSTLSEGDESRPPQISPETHWIPENELDDAEPEPSNN